MGNADEKRGLLEPGSGDGVAFRALPDLPAAMSSPQTNA
jgi:hypothetical protein